MVKMNQFFEFVREDNALRASVPYAIFAAIMYTIGMLISITPVYMAYTLGWLPFVITLPTMGACACIFAWQTFISLEVLFINITTIIRKEK